MAILSDWPEQERPRERLYALGAAALSDAELLAIVLRTGVRGKSAVDLSREILKKLGGICGLISANDVEWQNISGLGKVKRAQVLAGIELARRMLRESLHEKNAFTHPSEVADYLRLSLAHFPHETFGALWLDNRHQLILYEEIARGTLNEAAVYPREVIKRALAHNAAAVIFAHNHPSGQAEPSDADLAITRQLVDVLALIDVRILDHFVVTSDKIVSMAAQGVLPKWRE
ncbi:MAG: DNA repair protein RadC [Burkholderiales bacterium]|nr:DNA repair protein RadC [Burkholderiales bacterium]